MKRQLLIIIGLWMGSLSMSAAYSMPLAPGNALPKKDLLQVPKAELSAYMVAHMRPDNLVLDTRSYSANQSRYVQQTCDSILRDFTKGELRILEPHYVAQHEGREHSPKPFQGIVINDIYVKRGENELKYAKPQPPFEFYKTSLRGQDKIILHAWYSRKYDREMTYDSQGIHRIFNASGQLLAEQKTDYSSNGDKPDSTNNEGFSVLAMRNQVLLLITSRMYFDNSIPNDFVSIKQFDEQKSNFVDACKYYGKNIKRLFRS